MPEKLITGVTKPVPLITVQVLDRNILDQLPSVNNSDGLSPEYWARLQNEFQPIGYVETVRAILGKLDDRLMRIHYLVYLDLAGVGLDAQLAQRKKIQDLPQLFLK